MSLVSHAWFLTGPTACGKTAVGLALAEKIDAEIVSMDSMAIYRGMDIGTAKPTADERQRIRHHLIDIAPPVMISVWLSMWIRPRQLPRKSGPAGEQVLFVGGTPLYLKGLLRGIFSGPARRLAISSRPAKGIRRQPAGLAARPLEAVDPVAAARLHANDIRRIIRALEVFEKTGRPISEWQQQFDAGLPAEACRVLVIDRPKAELHARIDRRVEAMFAAGLVEEVRRLLADPRGLSKTARQAVGYAEVIDYCGGKQDLAATVELVKTHTRQLAKRQATWFRSLSECRFVPCRGGRRARGHRRTGF